MRKPGTRASTRPVALVARICEVRLGVIPSTRGDVAVSPPRDSGGIPATVWNMDSPPGAITEAAEAGPNPEDVRKFAIHADRKTTQRYGPRSTSRVVKLPVEHRDKQSPNKPGNRRSPRPKSASRAGFPI